MHKCTCTADFLGEPVHKFREFGAAVKEMDLLDESKLSSEQMRVICSLVLASGAARDFPHPDEDWDSFYGELKTRLAPNNSGSGTWNPLLRKYSPWIDLAKLRAAYNPGSSSSSSACTIS
jgi:hypothetical protein